MKFTKDVAVFAATVATTFAQFDLTSPILNGCNNPEPAQYDNYNYDSVVSMTEMYEATASTARLTMEQKRQCRLSNLILLQNLTGDPKVLTSSHASTELQLTQMGDIHDLEYRVKKIEGFELPHATDDFERTTY
jgi:hypothetical protein